MKSFIIKTLILVIAFPSFVQCNAQIDSLSKNSADSISTYKYISITDSTKLKRVYWYPVMNSSGPSYIALDSNSVMDFKIAKYMNQGSKKIKSSYVCLATGIGLGIAAGLSTDMNTKLFVGAMSGLSGLISIGLGISGGVELQKASDLMVIKACPSCVSLQFRIK